MYKSSKRAQGKNRPTLLSAALLDAKRENEMHEAREREAAAAAATTISSPTGQQGMHGHGLGRSTSTSAMIGRGSIMGMGGMGGLKTGASKKNSK